MSPDEIVQAESLISQFPSISKFFGNWISKEIEKAKQPQPRHIFLDYLASPYGYIFAEKTSKMFETVLNCIPSQCPRLRRKILEKTEQSGFESVLFELEIGSLLLNHGHDTEVEPLKSGGPDLMTVFSGYDTYIEAKKLQREAKVELMRKRVFDLEGKLESASYPVSICFTLTPQPKKHCESELLKQIADAVENLKKTGFLKPQIECIDKHGKITAVADLYPPDTKEVVIWGMWTLEITPDARDRRQDNLYWRYLKGNQFPNDGLHVLVVDTSKSMRTDTLLSRAWEYYCRTRAWEDCSHPPIHSLILCPRQGYWLNDLTVGAVILQNKHSPLPNDVFETLKGIFQ